MAFVLQEAILLLREQGGKAYIAFLDVKKAFDTVWHVGPMVKLHHKGITSHLWYAINNWYSSSSSCVLWSGQQSSSFLIKQGIRQGGILSPFLYCIFLNELLDQLSSSGVRASIAGIYCGSPIYTDDISLIAASPWPCKSFLTWSISTLRNGDTSSTA